MDVVFKEILINFNEFFTFFLVFPALILMGIYLTIRLRFVQISKLKMSFLSLIKKNEQAEGHISPLQAVSAVLAGNFGTGNISGMAVALTTGGPGALVWMWVMAFLGAAIQYASCMLAVKYRSQNERGEYVGGPMYYLRDGLGMKGLSYAFALFTIFASLTVGNLTQINSVTLPMQKLGFDPLLCGIAIAFFVGMVILGGIQRLAKFASIFVPFKACLYLGTAFFIMATHWELILPSLSLMFHSAINFSSVAGGMMGYGLLKVISTGFERGIFATDAGTGIVPILQASARTSHPVIDGVVSLIAPLLVMIVCTTTGLVLIMTGAWQEPGIQSTNMVTYAFQQGLGSWVGGVIVLVSIMLFAYTTILAWAYCGEKAAGFCFGSQKARWFRYLYVLAIPIGALVRVDLVWALADTAISCMLLANMIGVVGLSREVIHESRDYFLALNRST